MKKLNLAVIFGGTNTEHEVSIITALQAMNALKEAGYQVTPVYISKSGQWLLGNQLLLKPETFTNLNRLTQTLKPTKISSSRNQPVLTTTNIFNQEKVSAPIDAVFPIFHGNYGEDGSIQGMLKLLNIPIIGSSLSAASIGMDKYLSKCLAKSLGIPIVPGMLITHQEYLNNSTPIINKILQLAPSVIIKPNTLGSSIGISTAKTPTQLKNALEIAFTFDHRVLVEKLLTHPTEVQISIMGNDPYQLSITEQPLSHHTVYSYTDKYIKGNKKTGTTKGMASASRLIPAPITKAQDKLIRQYTTKFYRAIFGQGLSRVDFLIASNQAYFNEINIIPGSLSFYLWEKTGYPFPKLVDHLVQLGLKNYQTQLELVKTFESNILANFKLPA